MVPVRVVAPAAAEEMRVPVVRVIGLLMSNIAVGADLLIPIFPIESITNLSFVPSTEEEEILNLAASE